MSGSGKASVLKAFEDLDYYCVDNLPIELIPRFADLAKQSAEIEKAALVADIREGEQLKRLPKIIHTLRKQIHTTVLFLEASDDALLRRFSETRRPHPLGKDSTVKSALKQERRMLQPIRMLADLVVDSSKFNVHELRSHITGKFTDGSSDKDLLVSVVSYLIPHYVREGKSYLTIGFGCTGGQHRSVLIAEEVKKLLSKAGFRVKVIHRDAPK
jgi:UPF0042 nucleotide-binding protein